jgi:flagellin-like protein
MRRLRSKRALSPLIATVVLISATIVGGMLVYNYFQKSFNSVAAKSGALELTATSEYLNETHKLVHLEIYNTYGDPVQIVDIKGIDSKGNTYNVTVISGNSSGEIASGEKYSIIAVVPSSTTAIYVDYRIGNSQTILQSTPVKIS